MKSKRILVWGDLMCDEYVHGEVWRISREAPVLILKKTATEYRLGGAANAANNIISLGGDVSVMGVIGNDDYGKKVLSILKKKKGDIRGVIIDEKFSTITKMRIMAGGLNRPKQQVIRIDNGERIGDNKRIQEGFLRHFFTIKDSLDGVLFSDYSYGAVNPQTYERILKNLLEKNIPIAVDSRFNLTKYKNATLLTPNEEEVAEMFGIPLEKIEESINDIGRRIMKELNPQILILTRGRRGMEVFLKDKKRCHIPIYGTSEVTDVTGAGDTVCSVATLALSCGAGGYEAAQLANYAAGMVVMKMGCATVTPEELKKALKGKKGE